MASTLDRIFSPRALNISATEIYKEMPFDSHLQQQFMQGEKLVPNAEGGEIFEYDKIIMPTAPAPFTHSDGEFKVQANLATKNETIRGANIKIMKLIPSRKLFANRATGELRDNAPAVIRKELRGMAKTINYSKELFAAQALKGSVSMSSAVIPDMAADAAFSYSFSGVQSHTVGADWSNAGTGILGSEVKSLKSTFFQSAYMPLGKLLVDSAIPAYLVENTEAQAYFGAGSELSRLMLGEQELVGAALEAFRLKGLDWEVNENGYNLSGTFTKFLGDNYLIGLPKAEFLEDVLAYGENKGAIPLNALGQGSAADVIGLAPEDGVYAFAEANTNPVGVMLYMGWCGTFCLKHEAGVIVETDVTTT